MASTLTGSVFGFPKQVQNFLQLYTTGCECGIDGHSGYAWVFARAELLVWSYRLGPRATVTLHRLPYDSAGRHFIQVLTYQVHCLSDSRSS